LPISWNIPLVVLSVLVAMIGSFTALTHAQRMRESSGHAALWWRITGSITLGAAIWSMHFIGMLAMRLPIPLAYDLPLTLFSIVPAIAAAMLGFWVLREVQISNSRLLVSGLLMGVGISAMHYTGVSALKMSPALTYDPQIFILSVLVGVFASWGALLMMYQGERIKLNPLPRFMLGAVVMGLAISSMHYIAVLGTHIQPDSICLSAASSIAPNTLALLVSLTSLFWFGGGIIATLFDQRMSRQNERALVELAKAYEDAQERAERQAEEMTQSLRDSHEALQRVLNSVAEGIYGVDMDGRCTFINASGLSLLGYADAAEVVGKNMHKLIHHSRADGSIYPAKECRMYLAFMQDRLDVRVDDEVFWRKDGSSFPVEYWSHPIIKDGEVRGAVATFFDISERKHSEQKIHRLAFFDALTNLPNRRLLMDRLRQAFAVSARNGQHGAVMFLDLDNFKTLNDTKGHDIGDLLLIEVAQRLSSCVRDGDTVARLGGDEFVVVLETLSGIEDEAATQAERVAEKIQSELNRPYQLKDRIHHTTPSIGIAMFQGHQDAVDDLLKYADVAMYQAKKAGRNTIRFYDPETQSAIEARADLEAELRFALENRQFQLYYQIQVDSSRRPVGAEVLLRWMHPERGLVAPMHFIPLMEESGLIVPVGLWVLEAACSQLGAWQGSELTKNLTLAVNVSAKQFRQADFVARVQSILQQSAINPARLKLELTESMVLENVADTIAKMGELKLLGVSFSMDDFGTGYSSLQYLKQFPLDQIKIDRSFVRDITSDANDAAIVQAIIAMSSALGLEVIAEGVETEAQCVYLDMHGCHTFQGYLFGKPVSLQQFEAALSARLENSADACHTSQSGSNAVLEWHI
jgi:diguanylate cyclase (GGDEF)-like protein/PAS domain S-box-containing protein